jgi:ketosteroid isomerase-like protein
MYRFLLGTLLAASLHACQQRPGTDVEAVRRIIDKHNADLERWYAAGQVDSVAARFAEDVWQLPPNSPLLVGRDSLRGFWKTAVTWGQWEFDFAAQDVVASEFLAVERGHQSAFYRSLVSRIPRSGGGRPKPGGAMRAPAVERRRVTAGSRRGTI